MTKEGNPLAWRCFRKAVSLQLTPLRAYLDSCISSVFRDSNRYSTRLVCELPRWDFVYDQLYSWLKRGFGSMWFFWEIEGEEKVIFLWWYNDSLVLHFSSFTFVPFACLLCQLINTFFCPVETPRLDKRDRGFCDSTLRSGVRNEVYPARRCHSIRSCSIGASRLPALQGEVCLDYQNAHAHGLKGMAK